MNIRAGNALDADLITVYRKGTIVEVLQECGNGWLRIKCAESATGFAYRKTFEQDVKETLGLEVDISARIKPEWTILPKRWIVERTLAWINYSRRLSKDYEITVESAQAMCMIAALRTLIARF